MKKSLLFVDNDPGYSGSTVSMNYLLSAFLADDYEVCLVTRKNNIDLIDYEKKGIKIHSLKTDLYLSVHFSNRFSVLSLKGIYFMIQVYYRFVKGVVIAIKIIKKVKPDLIYVNEYVLLQFALAGKLLGIPAVTHIRSPFLKGFWGIRKKILSKLVLYCNQKVFAITQLEAKQISDCVKDSKNKLMIVKEFLNEENFNINYDLKKIKNNLGIEENRKIILMLGGIERTKGTYELLVALNMLRKEYDNICLVIAGTFNKYSSNISYWEECERYINENDLSYYLKILLTVKNINKLIFTADIIVSSSILTHFSRPIIEAWAKKKAVVASDTPHIQEYVNDNITGLVYKSSSPEELKEKFKTILLNPDLRAQLGNKGYEHAMLYYNGEKNTKVILKECYEILTKSKMK
jgi:glycosyltransferase involved in cell wall biosynthesis